MNDTQKRYLANKGRKIKDSIADENINIIVVNGGAGSGKTTLLRYIRDTAVFPNIKVIKHENEILDTIKISLTDEENTLYLIDEYPNTHIDNLPSELKSMRKFKNKVVIFSQPNTIMLEDIEGLDNIFINISRDLKE